LTDGFHSAGLLVLTITALVFAVCLPRGGKLHRFVGTEFELTLRLQSSGYGPQVLPDPHRHLEVMHGLAAAGAITWLMLDGLLWYAKPPELQWLFGSVVLGIIFFAGFFLYLRAVIAITRL